METAHEERRERIETFLEWLHSVDPDIREKVEAHLSRQTIVAPNEVALDDGSIVPVGGVPDNE